MSRKKRKIKAPRNSKPGSPRSSSYYLHFDQASKKIGSLSTNAYFQVKDIVASIIPSTNPSLLKLTDKHEEDLDKVIKRSNEVLTEATSVFPVAFFPDTVVLDRTKLTIHIRTFFMTGRTITIHIEDVLNVSTSVGPLFGSLNIAIRGLTSEDHFTINYFWRKDAIHLKHMIQGYIIALHRNIKTDSLSREKLLATLQQLGHDSNS